MELPANTPPTTSTELEQLVSRVGPELTVLQDAPLEDLGREGPPLLAEAVRRMRAGEVRRQAGYDGEYGVVRMFDEEERLRLLAQTAFSFGRRSVIKAGLRHTQDSRKCHDRTGRQP